ncbi:hypothetical protein L1987_54546 [Smallanthus sonchifolius]|uniref:Uncharacterized protein n=1 Tax=Smallanthus sonchifolius TaxID=185202 RepID=A0ACB9E7H8_9ASTR|nr:hypothetical protein L1987_54546 [Smallanthus sonchifolius]
MPLHGAFTCQPKASRCDVKLGHALAGFQDMHDQLQDATVGRQAGVGGGSIPYLVHYSLVFNSILLNLAMVLPGNLSAGDGAAWKLIHRRRHDLKIPSPKTALPGNLSAEDGATSKLIRQRWRDLLLFFQSHEERTKMI